MILSSQANCKFFIVPITTRNISNLEKDGNKWLLVPRAGVGLAFFESLRAKQKKSNAHSLTQTADQKKRTLGRALHTPETRCQHSRKLITGILQYMPKDLHNTLRGILETRHGHP